jgi:hypothetical protein
MFFIAYKAMTIGADVAEMKELLKDLRRGRGADPAPSTFAPPLDSYPLPSPVNPDKEFVLPEPLSRRLDAERGIRRDSDEDLSYGFKASERQH